MTAPIQHLGLAPGIHYDVGETFYHQDRLCESPTLSRSEMVTLVDESPLHLWTKHPRLRGAEPKEATAEMIFGSACHKAVLGKGADVVIIDADDFRTKEAKATRDAALAAGRIPLLMRKWEDVQILAEAFDVRLKEFGMFDDFNAAKSEVVLLWQESEHCMGRAMADKLLIDEEKKRAIFFDTKFCETANPTWLGKHYGDMNYHVQRAWYPRGLAKLRPDLAGRISWIFLNQETSYPFAMVPCDLDGQFTAIGESKSLRAVKLWEECIASNKWPGYTDSPINLEPPKWLLSQEMAL